MNHWGFRVGAGSQVVRWLTAVAVLLALAGCSGRDAASSEAVGTKRESLSSSSVRTYGFESLEDWSPLWSSPILALSSTHSEGQSSLGLRGGGWMQIQSRPLSREDAAPSVVGYDVRVPPNPVNPSWYGTTELSVDAPSAGIWGQFVGHAELTALPKGQFKRVEFTLSPALRTKLDGSYSDLRWRIAVNVPNNEGASYLVDRFTFGPDSPSCTPQSDDNPCTDDVCVNGAPAWRPRPAGTACDTNSTVCDGAGSCDAAAVCVIGAPPSIDDGNPCTADACDPVNGAVHLPMAAGVSCETDGNVCNGLSRCDGAGACREGASPVLDDGNPCTRDSCTSSTGVEHLPEPAGTSCDDDDLCNGVATCDAQANCIQRQAPNIDDGNPCTTDSCDPARGVLHGTVPNGFACDDQTVCNGRESCQDGACVSASPLPIDDGNPCTADACDPLAGAVHTALQDGTTCESDGDVCNGTSTCAAGTCVAGTPLVTDDGNPCTADSCHATSGVQHTLVTNGTACDDGNACTMGDECTAGVCAAGVPKSCAPPDACHETGVCNPADGVCSSPVKPDGVACDDGNGCTTADTCVSGSCTGGTPVVCKARDTCHVAGVCEPASGDCSNPAAADGVACDDDNVCNGHETCRLGSCVAAAPPVVDDANPCTADACDPILGVNHSAVADGTSCESDGDLCNGIALCHAGACVAGAAPTISDGNPCTSDTCDPTAGVLHAPLAEGTSCGNADVCDGDERCDPSGSCAAGTPLAVDDGDACTFDDCDPETGVLHTDIPNCRPTAGVPGAPFETRASILGRVLHSDGSPVTAFSIQVYDERLDHEPRVDVLTEAASDGSFRARLGDFPESSPERSPPTQVILRVDGPEFPTIYRTVYLRPGDAASVGDLIILQRDSRVTVIGPEGGVAQDSTGAFEVEIPPGALSSATPIRVTPIPERRLFPTPLPTNTITMYGVELEPEGTSFAVPAKLRAKNTLDLPTTMSIPVGVVDTTYGDWRHEGFATWDGSRFSASITHFSTRDLNGAREGELVAFRDDSADPNKGQDKGCINSAVGYGNGALTESIELPSYSAGGLAHAVTLNFNGALSGSVSLGRSVSGVVPPGGPRAPLEVSFAGPKLRFECVARGSAGSGGDGCGTGLSCGGGVDAGFTFDTTLARRMTLLGQDSEEAVNWPAGTQGDGPFAHIALPSDSEGRPSRSGFQTVRFGASLETSSCVVSGSAFGVASPGPDPSGGFASGNSTRVDGPQGPVADFPSYELFVHRRGSPLGSGWAVQQAKTLYRTPDRASADIVDGEGGRETFRPYPQAAQISPGSDVYAVATDTVTGEIFAASRFGGIQRVDTSSGALSPVAPGAGFGGETAVVLKVIHIGSERRFLAASRFALFEIDASGTERLLYTFDAASGVVPRFPGVAGVGPFAYFTEDTRALSPSSSTAVDSVQVKRIDLTAPTVTVEAITALSEGDLRLDPHGETLAADFQFQHPRGLAPALDGGLYVADDRRHAVYHLAPDATGQVGGASVVTRVLGSGLDTMIPGLGQSAPGLQMALRAPGELAVAADGTLLVTTANWAGFAALTAFDPVADTAKTVVLEMRNVRQIGVSFDQASLAPVGGSTVLTAYAGAIYRISAPLSSQFAPTRTLVFTDQGATVTDAGADTLESYSWLNGARTEGHLTALRQRSGEVIYSIGYVDDDRIAFIEDAHGGRTQLTYDVGGRLAEIRDPAGRATRVTVDDDGDLREIVLPDGEAHRFTYEAHRLVAATHPNGETATYTYSPDGTLLTATRPGGAVTTLQPALSAGPKHDATGRLYYEATVTDEHGVVHTLETNLAGAVVSDTYTADGVAYSVNNFYADTLVGTAFGEDIPNRLLRFSGTTINGLLVTPLTTWDTMGRAVSSVQGLTYPSSNEIGRVAFDANGRLAVRTFGPTYLEFGYSYDAAGHLVKAADQIPGDTGRVETGRMTLLNGFRPSDGQPTTVTTHGVTTTLTYDDRGRITDAVDTLGQTTATSYDDAGNPLHVDDGITTFDYTYDPAGRLTSATDADGNVTTLAYHDAGCSCSNGARVRKLITPDLTGNQAWTFDYNADGLLTGARDPLGGASQLSFNAQRELVATVDRGNRSTTFGHDQLGRVTSVVDLAGRAGSYTYALPTAAGWQGANVYAQSANATPAPTSLTAPLADGQYQVGTNAMATGADSSHAELYRDATFQQAFWNELDALGRQTWRADRTGMPLDSSERGPFPSQGISVPFTSAQTDYGAYGSPFDLPTLFETYDQYVPNGYHNAQLTRSPDYDLIEMPSFLGNTTAVRSKIKRDLAGRVTGSQTIYDGVAYLRPDLPTDPLVTYNGAHSGSSITYEPSGLVKIISNALSAQSLTYDARGLLKSRVSTVSDCDIGSFAPCDVGEFSYAYDNVGRNVKLTYPEGFTREQQFDALGRLTSRCYDYGTERRCYTATYDAVGNPQILTDPEMRREIEYDSLDRVVEVRRYVPANSASPAYVERYAYNALGGFTVYDNAPVDDQRPRLDGAGTSGAGVPRTVAGAPVTLDGGGRVTNLGSQTIRYFGLDNRAQSVLSGTTEYRLSYDGLGRSMGYDSIRTATSERRSATIYLYTGTGDNITAIDGTYRRLWPDTPGTTQEYEFGSKPGIAITYEGTDTPLWFYQLRQGIYYYELDTLGNVRRLHQSQKQNWSLHKLESDARDVGGYSYTAFGRTLSETEPGGVAPPDSEISSLLRWQARPTIAGFYDFRARLWSPELGTFLQPDQYVYLTRGGTLWSWPGNNPFRWRDPSGRFWEEAGDFVMFHGNEMAIGVAAGALAPLTIYALLTIGPAAAGGTAAVGTMTTALNGLGGAVGLLAGGKAAIDAAEAGDGMAFGASLGMALSGFAGVGEGTGSGPRVNCPTDPPAGSPRVARLTPGSLPAEEEAALLQSLQHLDAGTVPTGPTATKWGTPFANNEGHLPGQAGARPTPYSEHRVAPAPGQSGAGARRLVYDRASGRLYYTWTHYGQAGDPAFLRVR
jgi:RHS repeat-associated protein